MNKKILNFFLCGAMFIASAGMFVSCSDYDDDIKDLNQKIENLDKSLSGQIETKIQAVNTTIQGLQNQLDQVEEAYQEADAALKKEFNEENEARKADLAALKLQLETSIEELEGTLAELEKKHDKDVQDLIAKDAELNIAIEKAQKRADDAYALATLNSGRLDSVASALNVINNTLVDLQNQITTQGDTLKVHLDRILKLEARATSLEGRASVLEGRCDNLDDSVAALSNRIEVYYDSIERYVNQEVAAVQEALEDSVDVINLRIDAVEKAYKQADAAINLRLDEIEIEDQTKSLEGWISDLNARLVGLDEAMARLITGIIYQGQGLNFDTREVFSLVKGAMGINSTKDLEEYMQVIAQYSAIKPDGHKLELPVFYGKFMDDVIFPSVKGAEQNFVAKAGTYAVNADAARIYATINPSNVNFNGLDNLQLIDSEGEPNPFFALKPLQAVDRKLNSLDFIPDWSLKTVSDFVDGLTDLGEGYFDNLSKAKPTRAQNTSNGIYQMGVEYIGDSTVAPQQNAMYALAATYLNAADEESMVTSKYDCWVRTINLGLINHVITQLGIDSIPFAVFAYEKDAEGNYSVLTDLDVNPMLSDSVEAPVFEYSFGAAEAPYTGYVKSVFPNSTVYKFYIDYDSNFFAEAPAKVVRDGQNVNDLFAFTCKESNLNKATKITYHFLNYDGSETVSAIWVSYTKEMIAPQTLTLDVYPGASADRFGFGPGSSKGYARIDLNDSLMAQLTDAEKAIYNNNAAYVPFSEVLNIMGTEKFYIIDGPSFKLNPYHEYPKHYNEWYCEGEDTIFSYNPDLAPFGPVTKNSFILGYNPAKVDAGKSYDFSYSVKDKYDHYVVKVNVKVNVHQPDHLDYMIARSRIEGAFGVDPKYADLLKDEIGTDDIMAWGTFENNKGTFAYPLDGAFTLLDSCKQQFGSWYLKDAYKAGEDGWTKSNNSKFAFIPKQSPAGLEITPNNSHVYYAKTANQNVYTFGEVEGTYGEKIFGVKQVVDYYNMNHYPSAASYEFNIRFVSPINFGLAVAGNKVADNDTIRNLVYNKQFSGEFIFPEQFVDFTNSNGSTYFDLTDARIVKVTAVPQATEGHEEAWLKNFKFTFEQRQMGHGPYSGRNVKVCKYDFTFNHQGWFSTVTIPVKVYVTDAWGVTSVLNTSITLDGEKQTND